VKYVALFVTFAWFYQAGGWNQNSRFDLVRAIVEERTLAIDDYHHNTGDKARWNGHYYSDKAPGLALAAVPAVAAARPFTADVAWLSWLATLVTAALPTALAAFLLHRIARRLGATDGGATFAALVLGLATPAWAYATLFFGHALAAFCLVAAFAAAVRLPTSARPFLLGLGAGLAVGWGTLTEFPTAPAGLLVCAFAVAHAGPRRVRAAAGIAAGGLLAVGALMAYDVAAFGAPFQTGYAHVEGFGGMKEGFMGVTWPKLDVLGEITFGGYRGLFFFAPVLVLAPIGWAREPRRAGAVGAAIVVYYLLFNAAYKYWTGGWSFGPRHIAPALPFLALPLAFAWSRGRTPLRALLVAAALVSGAIELVAVSTTAQPPENVRRPLGELLWPAFRDGDLSLNHQSFLEAGADPARLRGGSLAHDAWNLGEKMGLRGLASLVPLAGVWAAALVIDVVVRRRRGAWRSRTAAPPS
jgi:hypothetical protein